MGALSVALASVPTRLVAGVPALDLNNDGRLLFTFGALLACGLLLGRAATWKRLPGDRGRHARRGARLAARLAAKPVATNPVRLRAEDVDPDGALVDGSVRGGARRVPWAQLTFAVLWCGLVVWLCAPILADWNAGFSIALLLFFAVLPVAAAFAWTPPDRRAAAIRSARARARLARRTTRRRTSG